MWTVPFRSITAEQVPIVGGKNANLGILIRDLGSAGVRVPDGFAIVTTAFREHLKRAGLDDALYSTLDDIGTTNVATLARVAGEIRSRIAAAPLPAEIVDAILAAYAQLSRHYGEPETDVAVRSSATAEDLPDATFAGQHDSYLNVRGGQPLLAAVTRCMASLFTDRAIVDRAERGFPHRSVALSVGVQKMVRSDLACAGVMFTLDTETGFRDVIEINGAWGLGESVVKGRVSPDEIVVHKPTLIAGFRPIIERAAGAKSRKLVYGPLGIVEHPVAAADRERLVLDDAEILALARWGVAIEKRFGRGHATTPMDIEWAKDGTTGELFVVQARPETVRARRRKPTFELCRKTERATPLLCGISVGSSIAHGTARVIRNTGEMSMFIDGEILVASTTDADWEPVLVRAAAVVTDHGGRTCHAAIVARELGIPCVVGTDTATTVIATGEQLTVSCAEGNEGRVYRGRVAFEREVIDPSTLPRSPVPIMLNVGNPQNAFLLGQLPSAGVGLARIEFIIASQIGIHPMALVRPDRLRRETQEAVAHACRHYTSPADMFVTRLATGIGKIAAAFYPRPVIVRFSDFKSNEYASLIGGSELEPVEANPMLGFRGASRYYHPRYREGFALECRAIQRARDTMGLRNIKVLVPFCRTLEEGHRVLGEMASAGLPRGGNALEVYVMCEIPNNVILAAQFADLFDGFSIGSNDLTQLVLGIDRDSALLSPSFDEQDPGVKAMIAQAIDTAHRCKRPIGFCGQGPSDHPELAGYLAAVGIDSISVTADALPRVIRHLATRGAPR